MRSNSLRRECLKMQCGAIPFVGNASKRNTGHFCLPKTTKNHIFTHLFDYKNKNLFGGDAFLKIFNKKDVPLHYQQNK